MNLTVSKINSLRPKQKRYTVADGGGLFMDITPNGSMSWIFRYRLNGKQEKVKIGPYPEFSLKDAREKRGSMAVEVARGISPAEEKRKLRASSEAGSLRNPTVRDFGERYLAEQVDRNWKDPSNESRNLKKELFAEFGDRLLKDITVLDVQSLVYRKRDGGHPAAAIQLRSAIKRMYDYAIERRLVTINPATMVATRYIGKAVRRKRHLTSREIREFLQVVYQSNIRRQFKLALHIILLTLVRKSMLLEALWNEIDFEAGEWNIPKEHVKGRKREEHDHVVYLSNQVIGMLRELQSLAGYSRYVLPGRSSPNKPFSKNALNHALEGLTFEMDPFTIHDLRRSAATLLNEKGWDENIVEKALSHEKNGIAGIYNRAQYADQRKKMLQWWADYVDSLATESKIIIGNFGHNRNRTPSAT